MPSYAAAVQRELALVAPFFSGEQEGSVSDSAEVHSVFFGGGTPSLLVPDLIEAILRVVGSEFRLAHSCEITLEANPGTLGRQDLERLRRAGVNRLSLGAQSAQPSELRLLDRAHTFEDVASAVEQARRAGFDNINLDLIYGLPWQAMESWTDTLDRTLDLAPEHLSLYALSLEHGTPLRAWVERGLVAAPDPDAAAERTAIDLPTQMDETMLLGFRLTRAGVQPSAFPGRFGQEVEPRYGQRLRQLERDGLIERREDRLRLTAQGRLLGNRVFREFV